MRKKVFPLLITIVCMASLAALGAPSLVGSLLESVNDSQIAKLFSSVDQGRISKPASKTGIRTKLTEADIPDDIIYFVLFKHLVGLKEEADKEASAGLAPVDYIGLYAIQADLTQSQSQILFQTAQKCMEAIDPIDLRAKAIIDNAREKFPKGEVQSPEDIPPPPAELAQLQAERGNTILHYRDALKESLGEAKFVEFDQFARQKIAPQITNLSDQGSKGEVK